MRSIFLTRKIFMATVYHNYHRGLLSEFLLLKMIFNVGFFYVFVIHIKHKFSHAAFLLHSYFIPLTMRDLRLLREHNLLKKGSKVFASRINPLRTRRFFCIHSTLYRVQSKVEEAFFPATIGRRRILPITKLA